METENPSGRRPSGLFRSLSWIVREEGDGVRQQTTRRFSLRRKQPEPSSSMFSSLSDRLSLGSVSKKADVASIPQVYADPSPGRSSQQALPPYLRRVTDPLPSNAEHRDPSSSAVSVDTIEIQRWRIKPNNDDKHPRPTISRQERFSMFSSGLASAMSRLNLLGHHKPLPIDLSPRTSLEISDSTIQFSPPRPIFIDHPYGRTSGQDGMSESRFFNAKRSSIDCNQLCPPPRPKRAFSDTYPAKLRKPPKKSGKAGIDPAKWAEISISAADLVNQFGRENVLCYPSPIHFSDSSSEEEDQESKIKVPGKGIRPKEAPVFVSPEEWSFLGIPPSSPLGDRGGPREVDLSIIRSSMAGSMASLSKWPLPPHYEKFEANSPRR